MLEKRKIATLVAEFLGTGLLTMLVLSVQRSTIGVPFFVALIAGLTALVMVYAFGGLSGAYLNPAVTIGLWTARRVSTLRAVLLVAMELLGAWVGYYVYTYEVNNKLSSVGGHFSARVMVAEAIGAGILGIVWGAASFNKWSKSLTASVVGVAVMVAMIAASAGGIGLANPALALGIRAWVWGTYVAGPVIGAVIGVNLYGLLFSEGSSLSFNLMPKSAVVKPAAASSSAAKKPARKTSSRAKKSK